ncbi:hypothetical protein [Streptomyces sp. NPDC052292]|uniref:hypothetical protein n=1 Tax=Streptomyces sp. NPDC052292 TaxID=3155053 RepID=UPI0034228C40
MKAPKLYARDFAVQAAAHDALKTAVKARTQAINQLKAVLVIVDPALRERLSNLGNAELFRACARFGSLEDGGDDDAVAQATHTTLSAASSTPPARSSTGAGRFPAPLRYRGVRDT